MTNLVKRILVGLVGIPLALATIYAGGWFFAAALIILTTLALRELYGLAGSKHSTPNVILGLIWSAVIQLDIARGMITGPGGMGAFSAAYVVGIMLLLGTVVTLAVELFRNRENAFLNVALTVFGVCYVTLPLSCLMVLRYSTEKMFVGSWGDFGTSLVVTVFVAIWAADSVAYFVGMKFGKHKLLPRISPKKSWEGAIGGLVGSVAAFVGMAMFVLPQLDVTIAALCGALIGIVGPFGDFAESLLKRDAVVKDSGQLLPGHGGVLDRFDSMLFAAPLVTVIVYFDNVLRLFVPW